MTRTVPLLAPDERASLDLDALLEVAARCQAGVSFELLEGLPLAEVAQRVAGAGLGFSLAPIETPALLALLEARARWHPAGELPALFCDPCPPRSFERGAPATLRLIEASRGLLAPPLPADAGLALSVTSAAAAAATVAAAFDHALSAGLGKVTVVHAANSARTTDGLFLHAARNAAVRYQQLVYEDLPFEAFARRAVRDRRSFEVLVGPTWAADAALELLAAVADVPRPAGVVLGRDGLRLFGRHGASGGQGALFQAAAALFAHLGEARPAALLARALAEAALQADFARHPLQRVVAALEQGA